MEKVSSWYWSFDESVRSWYEGMTPSWDRTQRRNISLGISAASALTTMALRVLTGVSYHAPLCFLNILKLTEYGSHYQYRALPQADVEKHFRLPILGVGISLGLLGTAKVVSGFMDGNNSESQSGLEFLLHSVPFVMTATSQYLEDVKTTPLRPE